MNIPLFLIPIVVGICAQLLKKPFNRRHLSEITVAGVHMPRYGGMPSAHTAFAFSLLTTVALSDGIYKGSFVVAVAITIFILDDALRMRIFLGRHGQALRKLIDQLPADQQKGFPGLESRLGHKPAEVVAGAIIGVVGTLGLYLLLQGLM
ncbi:MAG: divergent PAP2 family protein [Candidatus Andersenbacteria bacterium]